MRQYKIFEHPTGSMKAVKIGWSWPAFFFSIPWALHAKMWWIAVVGMLITLVLGFVVFYFFQNPDGGTLFLFPLGFLIYYAFQIAEKGTLVINDALLIAQLTSGLAFASEGNVWKANNLLTRGFEHIDTVAAENKDGAMAVYLKNKRVS